MTDPFWEQLAARKLPTTTVPLSVEGGGTVALVLRALPPGEWELLCDAYPSTAADAQTGDVDLRAMRSTLLARSIVAPDGSPPRDPAWWDALAKGDDGEAAVTSGELDDLAWKAWQLNRRGTLNLDAAGKD